MPTKQKIDLSTPYGQALIRAAYTSMQGNKVTKGVSIALFPQPKPHIEKMPRRPRFKLAEIPQHLLQRGVNREPCFYCDKIFG